MEVAQRQFLKYVREGMTVYDRRSNKIGKVSLVFSGANEYQPEGVNLPVMNLDENLLPEAVRDLFPPHRVPDVVRKRMFQTGFIKIDTGLFASDRYALANQIESVLNEAVYLGVDKDDTFKF